MEGKALNFTVLIEQDEDGIYIAKVPDIQGCHFQALSKSETLKGLKPATYAKRFYDTQGKTVEQAMERVKEAIYVCM